MLSHFSHVWHFVTLQTVAHKASLSMGFSRQEYWSGLPCPPPGDLPDPGIEPGSLMSPAFACGFFTTSASWEAPRSREGLENDCGEEKGREAESHQPGPPCCIHSASILSFTQMKKLSSPTLLRQQVSQTALSWKKDLRMVTFSPGT